MDLELEREISKIVLMTAEDARQCAFQLLSNPQRFACVRAQGELNVREKLSRTVCELFSKYESVRVIAGEAYLGTDVIGPSEYQKGFLRIGTNLDFTEVAVRPMADDIYEIDGSEENEQEFSASRLPTVFHWILVTSRVLHEPTR